LFTKQYQKNTGNKMLLFKKEHVKPILNGNKTQTRRIWKKPRAKIGSIHMAKTQMLSTEYFAKLKITQVKTEKIGDISEADSIKEGYKNKEDYLMKFFQINKTKLNKLKKMNFCWLDLIVYVVDWEYPLKEAIPKKFGE